MKPRLDPAPYTEEDSDIWHFVGMYNAFFYGDDLERNSAIVDRRDADLMLIAHTSHKGACCYGTHIGNAIALRGGCRNPWCGTCFEWIDGVICAT